MTNAGQTKTTVSNHNKNDNPNAKINVLMYPSVWLQVPYTYIYMSIYNSDGLKIGMPFYMYNSDGLKTRMPDANEILKGFQNITIIIRTWNARYMPEKMCPVTSDFQDVNVSMCLTSSTRSKPDSFELFPRTTSPTILAP